MKGRGEGKEGGLRWKRRRGNQGFPTNIDKGGRRRSVSRTGVGLRFFWHFGSVFRFASFFLWGEMRRMPP